MIRKCAFIFCVLLIAGTLYAANKEQQRLENSGVVMQEIINTPENIPREILEKAYCVIVFPSFSKRRSWSAEATAVGRWFVARAWNSRGRGALQQCMHLRAAALDFKSADKLPISFC